MYVCVCVYVQYSAPPQYPGPHLRLPHPSLVSSIHPADIIRLMSLDAKLHPVMPLLRTLKAPSAFNIRSKLLSLTLKPFL